VGLKRKEVPSGPPGLTGSLAEALAAVPEPRRPYGWSPGRSPLPLVGMLQVTMAATLCGARSLYAIAQWARERVEEAPDALTELGLPAGRSPSVATLHRVFRGLDVAALAAWVERTGTQPIEAIALDGKTLRGIHGATTPGVHLVAASAQAVGAVLGQVAAPGKGHELAAAKAVLATLPVAGRVITGDALLTQRAVCEQIIARGGDYLFPVDGNQPSLESEVAEAFSPLADGRRGRADRS